MKSSKCSINKRERESTKEIQILIICTDCFVGEFTPGSITNKFTRARVLARSEISFLVVASIRSWANAYRDIVLPW